MGNRVFLAARGLLFRSERGGGGAPAGAGGSRGEAACDRPEREVGGARAGGGIGGAVGGGEKEGGGCLVLGGEGGEESARGVWGDAAGKSRVRASARFCDEAVDRFLSRFPLEGRVEVE